MSAYVEVVDQDRPIGMLGRPVRVVGMAGLGCTPCRFRAGLSGDEPGFFVKNRETLKVVGLTALVLGSAATLLVFGGGDGR